MSHSSKPRLELAVQKAKQLNPDIYDPAEYDIEELAACQNIYICENNLKKTTARLTKHNDYGLITLNSEITEDSRRRFSIAHEMGHYYLHGDDQPAFFCTEDMFFNWCNKGKREAEANAFAAEFLMPRELFRRACKGQPPGKESICTIAQRFRTSLTATCVRYVEIGPYPCILFVSKNGILSWYIASYDFQYHGLKTRVPVHEDSCAGDYFANGIDEFEPQKVMADAWFNDGQFGRDDLVTELPFCLKTYNTVLSLVWTE